MVESVLQMLEEIVQEELQPLVTVELVLAAGSTDSGRTTMHLKVNSILRGQAACSVLDECNKQIDQAARTSLDLLRSLEKVTSEEEVKALLSPLKTGGSASQAATSPKSYHVPNSLTTDAAQIILDRMQTIIKLLLKTSSTQNMGVQWCILMNFTMYLCHCLKHSKLILQPFAQARKDLNYALDQTQQQCGINVLNFIVI